MRSYEVRKLSRNEDPEATLLTSLRRQIFPENIRGSPTVMRDRFEISPCAYIAYHNEDPIGFLTYTVLDPRFVRNFKEGGYKGHIDLAYLLPEDLSQPSKYLHFLSLGVAKPHTRTERKKAGAQVNPAASYQLLDAVIRETQGRGFRYLTAILSTDNAKRMFRTLDFDIIHSHPQGGIEHELAQYEIGDVKKKESLVTLLRSQ